MAEIWGKADSTLSKNYHFGYCLLSFKFSSKYAVLSEGRRILKTGLSGLPT